MTHGANSLEKEDRAFAEKIAVKADAMMRIPDNMTFEEAALMGCFIFTVGQGLFRRLGLRLPNSRTVTGEIVFIYGGSTSVGAMALQLVKLAGYNPITVCSPNNFELVKSYGAGEVWNYNDTECIENIKQYENKIDRTWDTISLEASANFCAKILAPGGKYGKFLSPRDANNIYGARIPREDAEVSYTAAYTALGDPVEKLGVRLDDNTAGFGFHQGWVAAVEPLLAAGKIKSHPLWIRSGFEDILDGLALVKSGTISGKLVYTI